MGVLGVRSVGTLGMGASGVRSLGFVLVPGFLKFDLSLIWRILEN